MSDLNEVNKIFIKTHCQFKQYGLATKKEMIKTELFNQLTQFMKGG